MAHADEWWTQASDFSSGSYTDPAGERCWGRSEKKWSISIKLMLFNLGTSGSRCVETAQIVESAPVKVGGPDLLPSPESWNGPRWESCGLPLYYVPPLCLKYPVDFQLEGLHLPRAAWVCQRCVHPVFLPPWFRDRPSRGLCACALKEMTMGRRHLCKLLSINDTQTFHLKKKKKKKPKPRDRIPDHVILTHRETFPPCFLIDSKLTFLVDSNMSFRCTTKWCYF